MSFRRKRLPSDAVPLRAMRSQPIAHRTGGLADTVEDGISGFLFSELSLPGLMDGITRAFSSFGAKRKLVRMQRIAMERPKNWLHSSRRYNRLYESMVVQAEDRPQHRLRC